MMRKIAGLVGIVLALGLVLAGCPMSDDSGEDGLPSLWQVYENHFALGNIIQSVYRNDLANRRLSNLLSRHFNLLTAENDMKPSALRGGGSYPGTWNWFHAERLLSFAEANDIRFHGHTLAWHAQTPRWLVPENITRTEAIGRLERHIETVMLRVGNRVESWDVLNEVITSGGPYWYGFVPRDNPQWDWRLGLRNVRDASDEMHPGAEVDWRGAIGDDYVEIAFRKARRVANENNLDVILYYNDYNLARFPIKMYAVYRMVKDINERHRDPSHPYHYLVADLPNQNLIQAIGTQGHYNYTDRFITSPDQLVQNMRNTLVRFASLDVYVSVTEFTLGYGTSGTDNWERRQAITMARFFNLFTSFAEAHPNRLRRISLWGPDDGNSWRTGRAHLWDANLRPKEAFFAVADPDAFLAQHASQFLGEFAGDTFTLSGPGPGIGPAPGITLVANPGSVTFNQGTGRVSGRNANWQGMEIRGLNFTPVAYTVTITGIAVNPLANARVALQGPNSPWPLFAQANVSTANPGFTMTIDIGIGHAARAENTLRLQTLDTYANNMDFYITSIQIMRDETSIFSFTGTGP